MGNTSELTDLIIKERVAGLSYLAIEKKHGVRAEEARELVRQALTKEDLDDEWERRGISMLRLEKVIELLWRGVERGEFKHAEAIIKAIEQTNQLLALNKEVIKEQKALVTDEQAALIYLVIQENNRQILGFISDQLKPNKRQQAVLEEWPQVTAEASTLAIESTIYEGEVE